MEKVNVDSLLTDGKIKSKDWKKLSVGQRRYVLDQIDDEVYDMDILDLIAPQLQDEKLPENYAAIQLAYMREHRLQPRTQASIETLRETVSKEKEDTLEKILENQQKLMEQYMKDTSEKQDKLAKYMKDFVNMIQESNKQMMHVSNINAKEGTSGYFGWDVDPGFRFKLFDEHPDYTVLEDYNFKDQVVRYLIEPILDLQNPNGYFHSLKHVLTENIKFQDMVKNLHPTINFETLNDVGESRRFSFNLSMGMREMMYEFHRIFEESEEEYGSDTYKFIRKHLIRMSITVAKPLEGGCVSKAWKASVNPVFELRVQPSTVKDACFLHCVGVIRTAMTGKKHGIKFSRMWDMYDNLPPVYDGKYWMPMDRMKETEDLFGIKFMVLTNDDPEIVFEDESIKFDDYEKMERKYHFVWKRYDGDDLDMSQVPSQGQFNKAVWVELQNEMYYLMHYHNQHYSLIEQLKEPYFCKKCGSRKHAVKDLDQPLVRLDCLERLENLLTQEAYKNALPPLELVFFDFETFLKMYRQHPYMLSYIRCSSDMEVIDKDTIEGFYCAEKFVQYLSKDTSKLKYLIGYNSSSFDNYFLMTAMIKELHSEFSSNNSIIHKNKMLLLKDTTYKIITWDLCQFTKSSLADACQAYKIDGLKGVPLADGKVENVDHKEVWKLFEKYNYDASIFDSEEYQSLKLKEYCENDVYLTMELFKVVHKQLLKLSSINPLSKSTLAGLIYPYFNPQFEKLSLKYDPIFSSVPGGRTQVFQKGHFKGKFALIDINSSYPHVCIENKFGTGKMFEINDTSDEAYVQKQLTDPETGEERLYICRCDADQTNLPIKLPASKPDKPNQTLNWTSDIVLDAWLQPETIQALEEYGCAVIKKQYLVWEKSEYAIREKMVFLMLERMRAKDEKNKVRELIAKIMGNGFTGKCGEKNHDDVWCVAIDEKGVEAFKRQYPLTYAIEIVKHKVFLMKGWKAPKGQIQKPRHWNVRILDLARLNLWRYAMLFKPDELYYCDTDSLIVDDAALQRLIQEGKIALDPRKYGAMDLEATSDEIIIVSPKNYYMNDKKMSLKSYRNGDLWAAYYKDETGKMDKENPFLGGKSRCKEMYKCLLREDLIVTTTFTKITKKIGRKDETGEIELNFLHTVDTEKILE